jgi:hypothetical protein
MGQVPLHRLVDLTEVFVYLKKRVGSVDRSDELVSPRWFQEGLYKKSELVLKKWDGEKFS